MNKLATRIMLVTAILFLVSSLAFAADDMTITLTSSSNNFILSAPSQSFSVCQCATIADSISITNTGTYGAQYSLSVNQDYALLSTSSLKLESGETATIPIYINAPCNKIGSDTLRVEVSSIYGVVKELQQKIVFADCQNMQIELLNQNISAGVCEPFTTSFTITNSGQFSETYTVDVGAFKQYATLSASSAIIPSGVTANISIHYALPCDIYGNYVLDYTVEAEKNKRVATFTQNLFIDQAYNFSLAADAITEMCEEEQAGYSLFLRNYNSFTDTYKVTIDAPSFVNIELVNPTEKETLNDVIVPAGQGKEILVSFIPDGKKHYGMHNFTITATSLNGDVVETFSSSINVLDCYNFENHLDVPYKDIYVCGFDNDARPFEVRNNGEADVDVELVLTAPNFMSLDDAFVSLDAKSQESNYLLFDDVRNITQIYPITLSSYFRGDLVAVEEFTVHTNTAQECYVSAPTKQNFNLRYVKDSFIIPVKNEGTRYGWYDAELTDSSFLEIDESFFDAGRTETNELVVNINKEALFAYLAEEDKSLIDYTLDATLLVTHLDSGLEFSYPITITFVDYPWTTYAWNSIKNESPCLLVFYALAILILIFLILLVVRLTRRNIFRSKRILGFILLGMMIIATAVVFLIWGVPQSSDYYTSYDLTTNSTSYLRLAEDKPMKYDLNDFFFDPDYDITSFGVNLIFEDELTYELRGSKIKLIPAADWSGGTIVRFFAVDSYGEIAQSPDIFVEVLPVEDYTLKEFFALTCVYVDLLMLLILSILIFVASSLRNRKKELARLAELARIKKEEEKKKREEDRARKKAEREAKKKAKAAKAAKSASTKN